MLNGGADLLGMLNGVADPVAGPKEDPKEYEGKGSGENDLVGGGPALRTILSYEGPVAV